jgi:hypothetical protein
MPHDVPLAANDATCKDPAIAKHQVEQWAQRALAANGFGDVATTGTASSARPTSYELYHAASAHRSFILGKIIIAAIQAIGAVVCRAHARYRQRRQTMASYDSLAETADRRYRTSYRHFAGEDKARAMRNAYLFALAPRWWN